MFVNGIAQVLFVLIKFLEMYMVLVRFMCQRGRHRIHATMTTTVYCDCKNYQLIFLSMYCLIIDI
jgi:hypothetical protein